MSSVFSATMRIATDPHVNGQNPPRATERGLSSRHLSRLRDGATGREPRRATEPARVPSRQTGRVNTAGEQLWSYAKPMGPASPVAWYSP